MQNLRPGRTFFLHHWRTAQNTQPTMVGLLRQALYSRLAGYEDTNDAERLACSSLPIIC